MRDATGKVLRRHVVSPGESLSSISGLYYGTQSKWRTIWAQNIHTVGSDPDRPEIGQTPHIPRKGWREKDILEVLLAYHEEMYLQGRGEWTRLEKCERALSAEQLWLRGMRMILVFAGLVILLNLLKLLVK